MNTRPTLLTPWRYFRRRAEDSWSKWLQLLTGWIIIALGAFDVFIANSFFEVLVGSAVISMGFNFFLQPRITRNAYRRGYIEARATMFDSLRESQIRGLDVHEWAKLERERDVMVLIQHVHDP